MSDKPLGRYQGPSSAAPYPLSRMAPAFSLVDVAAEIQHADAMLATVTGGKLEVIAEQIRALKDEARALLERARRDAELHRVRCNFEKKPGGVYHLYREPSGETWFSLIAPNEWVTPQDHRFCGSFRLEADFGFTRLDLDAADSVTPKLRHERATSAIKGSPFRPERGKWCAAR